MAVIGRRKRGQVARCDALVRSAAVCLALLAGLGASPARAGDGDPDPVTEARAAARLAAEEATRASMAAEAASLAATTGAAQDAAKAAADAARAAAAAAERATALLRKLEERPPAQP